MPSWPSMSAFVDDLGKTLTPAEQRKITLAQAEAGQKIADAQAARSLGGDGAFSGWVRGNPIPLDTHIKKTRTNGAVILPKFPGGWTVAEQGRNQGNASGFAGPGINTLSGQTSRTKAGAVRKVRARRARRWNGVTKGKDTATKAVTIMERQLPPIADAGVLRALRKRFDVT